MLASALKPCSTSTSSAHSLRRLMDHSGARNAVIAGAPAAPSALTLACRSSANAARSSSYTRRCQKLCDPTSWPAARIAPTSPGYRSAIQPTMKNVPVMPAASSSSSSSRVVCSTRLGSRGQVSGRNAGTPQM